MSDERPADPDEPSTLDEVRWLMVRVEPSSDRQGIIDALFAAGSLGVHEDGSAIVTHYPPGTLPSDIVAAVLAKDPAASVVTAPTPPASWSERRASVGAHSIGRVRIAPPWLRESDTGAIEIIVEPAMAFGTGEHATTRGVVRLLQLLPSMPSVVADVGAGSAVLAICAAKLGAERVVAIELDPDAIGNAEVNVAANSVNGVVHVIQGDAAGLLPLFAPVGLVLANIISSILLELLPIFHQSVGAGGHAILSGILLEERATMLDAIGRGEWDVVSEDAEEGWWSVLIARRP